jgi:hypothetical protein
MLIPVALPPGRASEGTKPAPTISSAIPRMGKVCVALCAARTVSLRNDATSQFDLARNWNWFPGDDPLTNSLRARIV